MNGASINAWEEEEKAYDLSNDLSGREQNIMNTKDEIIKEIKSTNLNMDKNLEEVTIRVGSKVLKFSKISEENISIQDEVRKEYENHLTQKLLEMSTRVKDKLDGAMNSILEIKNEYLKKERELKAKLSEVTTIPEITRDHARKGLFVCKGNYGELSWFVRRVYNPKFVDYKPLNNRIIKKMITPILIEVRTKGEKVLGVSTRKLSNLDYFAHYHQIRPDCWGDWKWRSTWERPEDIIAIADEATAVLENINTHSVATRSPSGLPRLRTLEKNIFDTMVEKDSLDSANTGRSMREKEQIRTGANITNDDIWMST